MTKTIKMSLAAALAVSALSTSASAGSLEEAIKGVSVKGKINVEYQNDSTKLKVEDLGSAEGSTNQTEYDLDITFKIPVNDMVTATIGVEADHDPQIDSQQTTRGEAKNNDVNVTVANFTYANGPVTAIVGKQNVGTPFLYDQKADGVVALYNAGPVTLAAAHFVNANIDLASGSTIALSGTDLPQGEETINALAVLGSVAGINMSAWYVTTTFGNDWASTELDGADAYSLNVNGKIADMFSFDVRHSAAEVDGQLADESFDDETLTKVVLGADLDVVALTLGYGMTNDTYDNDGDNANTILSGTGRSHGVSWDDDDTTDTGFNGEQAYLDEFNDADAFLLGASSTFGKFTVGAEYIDGDSKLDGDADIDFSELILRASYAMSKNFTISSYYSMLEVDTDVDGGADTEFENDEFSLALTYKF